MKHLIAFLCSLLVSAPLCAVEKDGLILTLTQEEDTACDEGGGCLVVPRDVLEKAADAYAQRAYNLGLGRCRL